MAGNSTGQMIVSAAISNNPPVRQFNFVETAKFWIFWITSLYSRILGSLGDLLRSLSVRNKIKDLDLRCVLAKPCCVAYVIGLNATPLSGKSGRAYIAVASNPIGWSSRSQVRRSSTVAPPPQPRLVPSCERSNGVHPSFSSARRKHWVVNCLQRGDRAGRRQLSFDFYF